LAYSVGIAGHRFLGSDGRRVSQKTDLARSQRQSAKRQSDLGGVEWNQIDITLPDAGKSGLVPPRGFVGEVVVSLVFLDRSPKSNAALYPRVRRIRNRAEWIHRLKITVAQIAEHIAMESIRSRARDDVDYAARSSSIFSGIAVGDDLKLLHRLLRYGRAHTVDRIVGGVGAVHIHQVRPR